MLFSVMEDCALSSIGAHTLKYFIKNFKYIEKRKTVSSK